MQWSLDIARTLFAENSGNGQWDIYALLMWLIDYRACIRLTGFAAGSEYVWEYVRGYCWYVFHASMDFLTYPNRVSNPYSAGNGIGSTGIPRAWFPPSINRFLLVPDLPGPFSHQSCAFSTVSKSPFWVYASLHLVCPFCNAIPSAWHYQIGHCWFRTIPTLAPLIPCILNHPEMTRLGIHSSSFGLTPWHPPLAGFCSLFCRSTLFRIHSLLLLTL